LNDSDLSVKLHSIAALRQISLVISGSPELLDQIHKVVEKVMISDVLQVGSLDHILKSLDEET